MAIWRGQASRVVPGRLCLTARTSFWVTDQKLAVRFVYVLTDKIPCPNDRFVKLPVKQAERQVQVESRPIASALASRLLWFHSVKCRRLLDSRDDSLP